jgi:hypothetical protein
MGVDEIRLRGVSRAAACAFFSVRMACSHTGFHGISTAYDRRDGVLVYHWTCEHCGARLSEAARAPYRPSYDPRGNERVQTVLQARAVGG